MVATRTLEAAAAVQQEIDWIFAAGGRIAKELGSGYEVRPGQITMAKAVEACFADGGTLLVEAPTGCGKSGGYLVPAILHALRQKRRVCVVTANIALQEQLIAKDLPMLQRVFADTPFKFALAKGLNNYLCLDRWDDAYALSLVRPKYSGDDEAQVWDQLDRWVHATTLGDLSELPFELPGKVRQEVTVASDDCIGRTCKHYEGCFGLKARKLVQDAQIVVTNYHLFFADLVIKQATDYNGGVLPEYDYVVLDEAHQAPDIARDFFGWRVSFGAVKWAVRQLPPDKRERVTDAAERFFVSLGEGPGPKGERIRPRIKAPGEVDGTRLAELLMEAANQLGQKAALELVPEDKAKLQKAEQRARDIASNLLLVTDLTQPPGTRLVYFAEPPSNPRGYWAGGMKPLDVAPILEKALFEQPKIKAVVGTSATLTTAGSFDFMIGQMGCYAAKELQVPSPFDHNGAAVLVVPQDLPDPKGQLFPERVGEVLVEAVRIAQGRTLGLFTSYKVLNEAYRALVAAGLPYKVFKQGDKPRTQLIADFRKDIHSVLLGTDSFWEGIDVQGEALSCVVIDRLPFEHPDDPVFEAICERAPKTWFMEYALPKSIIAMRQGFGRLIRSRTDRGAIVVCDRRIIDKPYGRRYIRSFPDGVAVVRNMQAIGKVLAP